MPQGRTRITWDTKVVESNATGSINYYYDTRYRKVVDEIAGDHYSPNLFDSKTQITYTGSISSPAWKNTPGFSLASVGSTGYSPIPLTNSELVSLVTQGLSRSSITRPSVRLPVAFAEFRELPRLIMKSGRDFISQLAGANIKVNFGILPMAMDLRALLSFTSITDKRIEEMKQTYSKGGLKRTYTRPSEEVKTSTKTGLYSAYYSSIRWDCSPSYNVSEWFSCRVRPRGEQLDSFPKNEQRLRELAYQNTLGIHWSNTLGNVWEAMPWSWLIDWFSNVGDYIESNSSSILFDYSKTCCMKKVVGSFPVSNIQNSNPSYYTVSPSGDPLSETYRWRTPTDNISPGLSLNLSFLTKRQISILSSLYILRTKRYLPFKSLNFRDLSKTI